MLLFDVGENFDRLSVERGARAEQIAGAGVHPAFIREMPIGEPFGADELKTGSCCHTQGLPIGARQELNSTGQPAVTFGVAGKNGRGSNSFRVHSATQIGKVGHVLHENDVRAAFLESTRVREGKILNLIQRTAKRFAAGGGESIGRDACRCTWPRRRRFPGAIRRGASG